MSTWKKHLHELGRNWMRHCSRPAIKEGWDVFNADGIFQIQVYDESPQGLVDDGEAYDLVSRKALEGSKLHILALYLDGRNADPDLDQMWIPKNLCFWLNQKRKMAS